MNTFVIGDIHGGYLALKQLIEKLSLKSNDQLIFLGDYVDGWSQSDLVIDYLMSLSCQYNCIFIRGNHDDLFLNYLKTNQYNQEWLIHGGQSTIDSYLSVYDDKKKQHIKFLTNLVDYYLDNQQRLFLHAGFTNLKGVEHEYFSKLFYWDRTLWEVALATDDNLSKEHAFYPQRLKLYSEVYIGHTPTTRIGSTKPVIKHNVFNLDTGAAFKGPLSAMNVETKEIIQSQNVYEFYPNEKGRN